MVQLLINRRAAVTVLFDIKRTLLFKFKYAEKRMIDENKLHVAYNQNVIKNGDTMV